MPLQIIVSLAFLSLLFPGSLWADKPVLSLETIFHPKQKLDFDGEDLPTTRWLPDGRLAIRHQDQWSIRNPDSGTTEPWLLPEKIAARIAELEDVSAEDVEKVKRGIQQATEDLNFHLLRVGKGWAWYDAIRDEAKWLTQDAESWQLATLAPDGQRVGFVKDGNLFVYEIPKSTTWQLTSDGSDTILNGKLDWVYQEEVYGRGNFRAFWFSPNSQKVAFLRLDQAKVPIWSLINAAGIDQKIERDRYPRAGDPLATVTLWVTDVQAETGLRLLESPPDDEPEQLIVRVGWRDDETVVYQTQDRIQKWLDLKQCGLPAGQVTTLLRETGGAWHEPLEEPHWLEDGSFLWLSDRADGRRHVYRIHPDGSSVALTSGPWNVWQIDTVAEESHCAIVTGSTQAGERHPYRLGLTAGAEPVKLSSDSGTYVVSPRKDGRWMTWQFSAAGIPPSLWLCPNMQAATSETRTKALRLGDNQPTLWEQTELPSPKFEGCRLASGVEVPLQIFSPEHVDLAQTTRKYPVLVHSYGGPMNPAAVNRWQGAHGLWHQFLANQGMVVVVFDPSSSAGRGPVDTWPIYGNLGKRELAELEEVLKQLEKRPWFNDKKVGMWGWSYGGFFTAYALTHSDRFCCGIAGAPVTDWRNYDAIYTERYMNLPQHNLEGYQSTSVVQAAEKLAHPLLIIHGGLDDNVHPTNTWQLIERATKAGAPIRPLFFPTARHAVTEPHQRAWLYQQMTEFLLQHLR